MRQTSILGLLALFSLVFIACEKDTDTAANAQLRVLLTDGPGDYQAVNVDVESIRIRMADDGVDEWTILDQENPGVFDLLQLTAGADTLLGTTELPAGKLEGIRLILGDNNTVTVDGQTYDLSTPSAQQSGLKIQLSEDLQAGVVYTLLLDFDVARSVVRAGNSGRYNLKPVIRATLEATGGSIIGLLDPALVAQVRAVSGIDTVSTYSNGLGAFTLRGVDAGTYTLEVIPPDGTGYQVLTMPNVGVTVGAATNVGTLQLSN